MLRAPDEYFRHMATTKSIVNASSAGGETPWQRIPIVYPIRLRMRAPSPPLPARRQLSDNRTVGTGVPWMKRGAKV